VHLDYREAILYKSVSKKAVISLLVKKYTTKLPVKDTSQTADHRSAAPRSMNPKPEMTDKPTQAQNFTKDSAGIALRATALADLPFVLAAEQHPDNAPYVTQWTQARHEEAIASTDEAHFIIEANVIEANVIEAKTAAAQPVGYLILAGLENPHLALEIRRIVIAQKAQGYGRQVLRWAKALAFETLGYHRCWLDVVDHNQRAKTLYQSEGFVTEGILRENRKTTSGYASTIVMGILAAEYRANRDHTSQN
jgi:diamine N-acetyltransferase